MSTPLPPPLERHIHLLYVPTLGCNLGCSYCYLGDQTTQAQLRTDSDRAVATLHHALAALEAAGVLAFNVSLHGGEPTLLPSAVLDTLFGEIRAHYLRHFDAISALGQKKSAPHIKTNLFKFAPLYPLFERHKVSISASIDLPLALHARHRTLRGGGSWIERTLENLRLLARYPHAKKISATVSAEHLVDIPAFIADIWFIHREIGFDMNQFNIMFAFAAQRGGAGNGLTPAGEALQLALYTALNEAFRGTELEEGLRRNWFDEFKPSYCTNAQNCGERFYLLQSDGSVYSCVRGQGLPEFYYGNIFNDSIDTILGNGARKISEAHQRYGFDPACQECCYLPICRTGCPVVKQQHGQGRSYTCKLQQAIYVDQPRSYPAATPQAQQAYARHYGREVHPHLAFTQQEEVSDPGLRLPHELGEERNTLRALIETDPILQQLYSPAAFLLEIGDEQVALTSQLLKTGSTWYTLTPQDRLVLHGRWELFEANCAEPVRNTLHLQLLRDTPVVYGDEKRTKQAHLFTYQIFRDALLPSSLRGPDYWMADLGELLRIHRHLYQPQVLNNLFFTTGYLREYHYQKQKLNAFYHLQAINLPFQNVEFFYLS